MPPPAPTTATPAATPPPTDTQSLERLQPDDLIRPFNRSPIGLSMLLAGLAHLLIIGVMSLGLVYEMVTGHELFAATPPPADTLSAAKGDEAIPAAAPSPDTPLAPSTAATPEPAADPDVGLTPVERRVTEAADPDELPALDDLSGL